MRVCETDWDCWALSPHNSCGALPVPSLGPPGWGWKWALDIRRKGRHQAPCKEKPAWRTLWRAGPPLAGVFSAPPALLSAPSPGWGCSAPLEQLALFAKSLYFARTGKANVKNNYCFNKKVIIT